MRSLAGLVLFVFSLACAHPAFADTITAVFSNPVAYGNDLNNPSLGQMTYVDNTGTAVTGTASAGGAACAASSTLCWGVGPDLGVPVNEQYSELSFTGSATFNPISGGIQDIGTLLFLNGTSDTDTIIFGATLSLYDGASLLGSYNVVINSTVNQYTGTGLTTDQLNTDADYINICGNLSNICGASIESYEAGEGGQGLSVDLNGNLILDPMLQLDSVTLDNPNCTDCGIVGGEAALAETPEPPGFVLMSTALMLVAGLGFRARFRRAGLEGL
jgi:hypothetical protein